MSEDTASLDLPAGVDPDELAAAPPVSRRRAVLRRRLRYLGRARELLLRDLGGLVYEIHRTAGGRGTPHHARLVELKVQRVRALDAEAAELAARVGDPTGELVLREPGIGGTCLSCGELHGLRDRFCAHCGTELGVVEVAAVEATEARASEPAPSGSDEAGAGDAAASAREPVTEQTAAVAREVAVPEGEERTEPLAVRGPEGRR